jgi:arsenate reductase (glutaredoxin)
MSGKVSFDITLYHYPHCRRSAAVLRLLKQYGQEFALRNYFQKPFTVKEMEGLLMRLNMKPLDIVRPGEKDFVRFRHKNFTDQEWIRILIEFPRLMRRPIVVRGLKAVIGENVEDVRDLLGPVPASI